MAGFGKALEIRQDPNAERTAWIDELTNAISSAMGAVNGYDEQAVARMKHEAGYDPGAQFAKGLENVASVTDFAPLVAGATIWKGGKGFSKALKAVMEGSEPGRAFSLTGIPHIKGKYTGVEIGDDISKAVDPKHWGTNPALKDVLPEQPVYKYVPEMGDVPIMKEKMGKNDKGGMVSLSGEPGGKPGIVMNEKMDEGPLLDPWFDEPVVNEQSPFNTIFHEGSHILSHSGGGPQGGSPAFMKDLQRYITPSQELTNIQNKSQRATPQSLMRGNELNKFIDTDPHTLYKNVLGEAKAREDAMMAGIPMQERLGYQPLEFLQQHEMLPTLDKALGPRDLINYLEHADLSLDPAGYPVTLNTVKPGKNEAVAKVIKEYEQKFGVPVKDWQTKLTREQLLEFKQARDLETGALEKEAAKGSPKTTKFHKMTEVGEDVPPATLDPDEFIKRGVEFYSKPTMEAPNPQTMKSPGLEKMKATKAAPAETPPVDVMGQTFAEAKAKAPGKATKKAKEKPIQQAIEISKPTMDVGMPTTSGQAVIREGKKITMDDAKELVFQQHEGKFGKPRAEWTPDELNQARAAVPEMQKMMEFGSTIGKSSPRFWTEQDRANYVRHKYRSLENIMAPEMDARRVFSEQYIGKPRDKWTAADQFKWTMKELEMENK
jgi:hypothetical protein